MIEGEVPGRLRKTGRKTRKGLRNSFSAMKRITVDLTNRLQRSFGNQVRQQVEIHYDGKPMTFNYVGPLEETNIDVLSQDDDLKDGKEELELKFDPTKQRMDTSKVTVVCSCGGTFIVEMDTVKTTTDKSIIREATRKNHSLLVNHYEKEGHRLSVRLIETPVQVIKEDERIKNFTESRINYYRTFSKKTAEVKYLTSYGQDLLSEAPQFPYHTTAAGKDSIGNQNFFFFLFIFGLIEVFTYLASSSSTSSYYSPINHPNLSPWYVLIIVMIIMIIIMWRLHIRDMARSMVKVIFLQSAPFYISNRGVLPVVMTNSTVNQVWDYQARMMNMDAKNARDVFLSLQSWSDSQIAQLYRANKLGQVEKELDVIQNSIRDLEKYDLQYKKQSEMSSPNIKGVIIAVAVTLVAYTMVLYMFGIY